MANARRRGRQLVQGLEAIAARVPIIREVRGIGLMIGLEIQSEAGEPAPALRDWLIELAFQRGLLLLPCGPSTIRFCPPLCLTARQVEIALELITATMSTAIEERRTKAELEDQKRALEDLAPERA
jgi:4-aminobutyrate aminotransferase